MRDDIESMTARVDPDACYIQHKHYFGDGMLRDVFAAFAVGGLLNGLWPKRFTEMTDEAIADSSATAAYRIADAMLKAREPKP